MLKAELISSNHWAGLFRRMSADFVFAALSQVLGRGSPILASILVANFMSAESFSTRRVPLI